LACTRGRDLKLLLDHEMNGDRGSGVYFRRKQKLMKCTTNQERPMKMIENK